jgi:UrcA family protein
MTFSKTLTITLIAASASALLPALAATKTAHEKQLEISLRGYDLANAADATEVFEMINSASERVCRITGSRQTIRARLDERRCRVDAVIKAVASINAPQLTEIMHEKMDN